MMILYDIGVPSKISMRAHQCQGRVKILVGPRAYSSTSSMDGITIMNSIVPVSFNVHGSVQRATRLD